MQTHDALWQVQRATAMFESLRQGQFPVRWVYDLDNGYGTPLFNFIYPGPYYLSSLFMAFGVVNITAIKIITILAYLAGGLGIYYFFRKHRLVALVSAVLYLLTPYQLVNIFVRGALGESLVIGLAPWIFVSLNAFKDRPLRWYDPLPLAASLLSHNFLGLLVSCMAFVYGLCLGVGRRTLALFLLAFSLSAFFLIPMIFERGELLSSATDNYTFVWSDHFVYPHQLLYSKWDYWYSMPGDVQDGMTFQLGFANIIVIVLFLVYLLTHFQKLKSSARLIYSYYIFATFLLLLLIIPKGRFLWELFPILQTMQFPWRLLGLVTIIVGLITGTLLSLRVKKHRLSTLIFSFTLLSLAFINTRNYNRPMKVLTPEEFRVQNDLYAGKTTTSIRSEVVPRYAPVERYQPTSLRLFNPRLGILEGNAEINSATDRKGNLTFQATAENERAWVVYYHNYYPSWQATVDGVNIPLVPTETGEISLPLLEGVHEYKIYQTSTPLAQLGNLISLSALLIIITISIFSLRSRYF